MSPSSNTSQIIPSYQRSPTSTFLREDELILSALGTVKPHHDAPDFNGEQVVTNKGGKPSLMGFDPLMTQRTNKDEPWLKTMPQLPILDSSITSTTSSHHAFSLNGGEIDDDLDAILNSGHRHRIDSIGVDSCPKLKRNATITNSFRRRQNMLRQLKNQASVPSALDLSFHSDLETPNVSPKSLGHRMSNFGRTFSGSNKSKSPGRSPHMTPTPTPLHSTADQLNMPLLAKPSPTSFLADNTLGIRSTEHNPAPHQVEILSSSVGVVASKLCAFLDFYRSIDINFELGSLVGVSRNAMNEFATLGRPIQGLELTHRPIVRTLLDCGESVTVEGYYADESEVVFFNSQVLHQLVVVYRGNDVEQTKPVKAKQSKTCGQPKNFQADRLLTVYPPFRDAYLKTESEVCARLDQVIDADPFTNVVFTGHSFGAAMSICAALRYSTMRPMTRVSCCALGAPKVGALDFKQTVNTLPNLKVFRVEIPGDQVVQSPTESNGIKWEHAGHTLAINPASKTIRAYRFDKNKPAGNNHSAAKHLFTKKLDRSSRFYAEGLEQFAQQWVVDYCELTLCKNARKKNEKSGLIRGVSVGKKL